MRYAALIPHPPLIIPGVGKADEIPTTRSACERIAEEVKAFQPETVIILSPHSVMYEDYIHISPGKSASGDFSRFRVPQVRFDVVYDEELADLIGYIARENGIAAGFEGERDPALDHGTMVPLYFLKSKRIVRLSPAGFGMGDHYRLGRCIRMAAERLGRRAAFIASGDMSHKLSVDGPYGYCREGEEHDAYVRGCLLASDFQKLMDIDPDILENAAECGFRGIVAMAGFLDGTKAKGNVLSYEAPYGVGYLCASFQGVEDAYVNLARTSVEHFIRTGEPLPELPAGMPDEMENTRAGVFVTIKKDGDLRGCIGTIAPTCASIAQEIVQNGVSAASSDPRFTPIAVGELASLSFGVDVLGRPEAIGGMDELDVKKYGVIVESGRRRGLLLPNLEGVDTVAYQVSIAAQKGGIMPGEPYSLRRFEVVRHT